MHQKKSTANKIYRVYVVSLNPRTSQHKIQHSKWRVSWLLQAAQGYYPPQSLCLFADIRCDPSGQSSISTALVQDNHILF